MNTTDVSTFVTLAGGEEDGNAVWGMPKYKGNQLANLSDEEYLAMVNIGNICV